MQKPKRHATFIKRQRLFSETDQVTVSEKSKLFSGLRKQRYKVHEENGHVLAEKGRFFPLGAIRKSHWSYYRPDCSTAAFYALYVS